MFRTVGDQPSLFEEVLPEESLRLPVELERVDRLLDDPAFFAPFVPFFDPRLGRLSTPMETYLRLTFLKFCYRLGYESLCREVSDSITWRRFCRIPLEGPVPHPTTLMKLTTRCGSVAVEGLNEALRAHPDALPLLAEWTDDAHAALADLGYEGERAALTTPIKHPAGRRLTDDQRTVNLLHAATRGPAERGNSLLKITFKALRRVSLCPWRIGAITAAALVLLHHERGRTT